MNYALKSLEHFPFHIWSNIINHQLSTINITPTAQNVKLTDNILAPVFTVGAFKHNWCVLGRKRRARRKGGVYHGVYILRHTDTVLVSRDHGASVVNTCHTDNINVAHVMQMEAPGMSLI